MDTGENGEVHFVSGRNLLLLIVGFESEPLFVFRNWTEPNWLKVSSLMSGARENVQQVAQICAPCQRGCITSKQFRYRYHVVVTVFLPLPG